MIQCNTCKYLHSVTLFRVTNAAFWIFSVEAKISLLSHDLQTHFFLFQIRRSNNIIVSSKEQHQRQHHIAFILLTALADTDNSGAALAQRFFRVSHPLLGWATNWWTLQYNRVSKKPCSLADGSLFYQGVQFLNIAYQTEFGSLCCVSFWRQHLSKIWNHVIRLYLTTTVTASQTNRQPEYQLSCTCGYYRGSAIVEESDYFGTGIAKRFYRPSHPLLGWAANWRTLQYKRVSCETLQPYRKYLDLLVRLVSICCGWN